MSAATMPAPTQRTSHSSPSTSRAPSPPSPTSSYSSTGPTSSKPTLTLRDILSARPLPTRSSPLNPSPSLPSSPESQRALLPIPDRGLPKSRPLRPFAPVRAQSEPKLKQGGFKLVWKGDAGRPREFALNLSQDEFARRG